jgi:hypothetical protein
MTMHGHKKPIIGQWWPTSTFQDTVISIYLDGKGEDAERKSLTSPEIDHGKLLYFRQA